MDQLSEKFISSSPYAYVMNNPISFFDPDGRDMAPWLTTLWGATKEGEAITFGGFSSDGTPSSMNSSSSSSQYSSFGNFSAGSTGIGYSQGGNGGSSTNNNLPIFDLQEVFLKGKSSDWGQQIQDQFNAMMSQFNTDNGKAFADWGNVGNAMTAGGIGYYGLEKNINNGKYWVDAKGNVKSTKLLERGANGKYVRGVQGLRNGQAAAGRVASVYGVAGKVVGGIGMGVTAIQYLDGQITGTEASVDLLMGGIGFTGWGAPISLMYFGGKFLYEYSTGDTLFDKPEGY